MTQRRHGRLENMKGKEKLPGVEGVKKIWKGLKMVVLSAFGMDLQIETDPQKERK